jgi:putative transcription antitermination factor YqgF
MHKATLAIDFGTKRIGLARSFATLAEPWRIVTQADYASQEEVAAFIAQLVKDEGFTDIVVGISENEMEKKTEAFIDQLQKFVEIPVHRFDETLSSKTVEAKLKSSGKSSPRRKNIDHFAAAEFLQEWLDEQ